ncbi:MAG TPA: DinB family protein [Planctomycetota bacterium]|nr:DinB family protein [Planctomycetota bacterium]
MTMIPTLARAAEADAAATASLARANALVLRQGAALVARLEARQFCEAPVLAGLPEAARGAFARGAVGAHFRHVLDHYDSFLAGLHSGRVDYDRRERERELERDPCLARERLQSCADRFERIVSSELDRALVVLTASMPGRARESRSSLGRELQFLASHTVHHYALIAVLVRLWGVAPDDDFGVAPSTLAFEQGVAPCAR